MYRVLRVTRTGMMRKYLILLLFPVVAFCIYSPAFDGGWYLDDYSNIVLNYKIKDPYLAFSQLFDFRGGAYFSFFLNEYFGWTSPGQYRAVNVMIHALNAILVVVLSTRIYKGKKLVVSILVGLVFLVHPVQSSAVSYVVQRMVVLSTFFALSSLVLLFLFYDRYRGRSIWCFAGAFLFFFLSVFTKENTVLLPLCIPLIAFITSDKQATKGWLWHTALFCILPAAVLLAQFMDAYSAVNLLNSASLVFDDGGDLYRPIEDVSWLSVRYLFTQGEVFGVYALLILFPFRQALDYQWPIHELSFPVWFVLLVIFVLLSGFFLYRKRSKYPVVIFSCCFFVVFILVESSFIPLDPLFEHRLYLPIIGIIFLVADIVQRTFNYKGCLASACVVVVVFSGLTWQRNNVWGHPVQFWQKNIAVAPKAIRPRMILAQELFSDRRYSEAVEQLSLLDRHGLCKVRDKSFLSQALYFAGDKEVAFQILEENHDSETRKLLHGVSALREGDYGLAEDLFEDVEKNNDNDIRPHYYKGVLYRKNGDLVEATASFQQAANVYEKAFMASVEDTSYYEWAVEQRRELLIELPPLLDRAYADAYEKNDVNAKGNYANLLLRLGLYERAFEVYSELAQTVKDYWALYYNRALAEEKTGRSRDAVKDYRAAARLNPANIAIRLNLSSLQMKSGNYGGARETLQTVVGQRPDSWSAWFGMGMASYLDGDVVGARSAFETAARIPGYRPPRGQFANLVLSKLF